MRRNINDRKIAVYNEFTQRGHLMKIEELKDTIQEILKNKCDYRSILIDGPWGCGKTTAVNNAIKELGEKHCKIYYQSLYGLKDVIELQGCYKKAGILKAVGKCAIPFLQLIPLEGKNIYDTFDKFIDNIPEIKARPVNDKIFIFDDFERIDKNMSYITLLGFFNQLVLNGCTIICISSLGDIQNKENDKNTKLQERLTELSIFKEKAFDRVLSINERPEAILKEMFEDLKIEGFGSCIKYFNNNIRMAKRVNRLFRDLEKIKTNNNFNLEKYFSKLQILKACICTIDCIFFEKTINKKGLESYDYLANKESDTPLDPDVLLRLMDYPKTSDLFLQEEQLPLFQLSKLIAVFELHRDKDALIDAYPENIKNVDSTNYLNSNNFYYLSDDDKVAYYREFKEKTLSGELTIDRWYVDRFVDICSFSNYVRDDSVIKNYLIKTIVKDYHENKRNGYNRLHDYLMTNERPEINEEIKKLVTEIDNKIHSDEIESFENKIKKCQESGDYSFLAELVNDIIDFKYHSRDYIIKWLHNRLLESNFMLPDLSETIDQSCWQYCHALCKYCSKQEKELQPNLEKALKKMLEDHKNSETCNDRVGYLLKQYFNVDTDA